MLSDRERTFIFQLAAQLTGVVKTANFAQDGLTANIERRMEQLGTPTLAEYLRTVAENEAEYEKLLSILTIHTTSWFRENPHFVVLQELLLEAVKRRETFKVWCAACSTGEEVYSFALMLEEFRKVHPEFDYRIVGTDIDALSLRTAQRAIYPVKQIGFHVSRYKHHLLEGSGKTEGFFTLSKEIRQRCSFRPADLREVTGLGDGPFDVCVCRNVLIYFEPQTITKVINNLLANVRADGHLILGHSESIQGADFGLTQQGHSVYKKSGSKKVDGGRSADRFRVLSIDDSPLMRKFFSACFTDMGFESVTVASGAEATSYLNFNEVDLITLDLNMPGLRGDQWLESERREGMKTPVVIVSDVHASDASEVIGLLSKGAQDYIEKNRLREDPKRLREDLMTLIRAHRPQSSATHIGGTGPKVRPDVILIGASTGGPQALSRLLKDLPTDAPPILITQHMAPKFTRPMAESLCEVSGLALGQVADKEPLLPGHIYMAYGDYHIGVTDEAGVLKLTLSNTPAFNGHRPSVDFMFNSALGLRAQIMAILLTGMGRDGALGLRFLRKEGSYCMAQAEADCVVYGMPKEAIERGAAEFVGTADEIRMTLIGSLSLSNRRTA